MSENISLLRLQDGRLVWLRAGDGAPLDLADEQHAEGLRAQLAQRGHRVSFAAPGPEVRLLEVETTREERRHLDAALPFMLEESLAEDIERLHFARVALDEERFGVAVVRHALMQEWQACLASWPAVTTWVPEQLSLPWEPGQWVAVRDGERVLFRSGPCAGAVLESDMFVPFIQALQGVSDPGAVILYGAHEDEDRALFPEALRARVQWRRGGLGEALLLRGEEAAEPLNLLQGDYAPRLPYERWWRQWRAVAALFAVALGAHLLAGWLDLRQLRDENVALRSEIMRVYREVEPRGAVADAERQLRTQLQALGGGGASSGFTQLLEPLGRQIAAQTGTALTSVSYSMRSGELRVNMLAPDFAVVERIRSQLTAAGLTAELENSSRSGDRVRARLRIAEASS